MIIPGRPYADRTAGDYYDSSEDIMKVVEGTNQQAARRIRYHHDANSMITSPGKSKALVGLVMGQMV